MSWSECVGVSGASERAIGNATSAEKIAYLGMWVVISRMYLGGERSKSSPSQVYPNPFIAAQSSAASSPALNLWAWNQAQYRVASTNQHHRMGTQRGASHGVWCRADCGVRKIEIKPRSRKGKNLLDGTLGPERGQHVRAAGVHRAGIFAHLDVPAMVSG